MSQPLGDITMKRCNNCEKPIEAPKFRIHEVQCARNNVKCHQCGEIIPIADKDHHAQEVHAKVRNLFILNNLWVD